MKKILISFLLTGFAFFSNAQRTCHSAENHERLLMENPTLMQRMNALEQFTENAISRGVVNQEKAVITIPVVFHILYNTTSQNVSDAQIMSQLDVLNKDFRKQNTDASLTPSTFTSVAADCEFNFCLANVAPNGSSTSGIIRKSTTVTSFSSNDAMKYDSQGGSNAWPAGSYLNIWVCNLGSGLLGYAQFPGGPAATDGVVINYTAFGTTGTAQSPFNKGRTATHEVGHWLNLRHIWGDANCGSDNVSDTPVHYTSNSGCPSHPKSNSCGTSAEMHMNYMDYTDDACMYMFTTGQKNRMQALFVSGGLRESLKNSLGCSGSSGTTAPTYCASSGSTTSYEWISKVQLNTINNTTTGSGGYADYTSISTTLNPGSSYTVSLTPAFSGSTYTEYFRVYIDYNNDKDFNDAGELVYSSAGTTTTVSGSFTVPSTATAGTTRMRVIMKDGSISGPCEAFTYGEVEDYSINIQAASTCSAPTSLAVSNVSSSAATLSWAAASGAGSYTVQVKPSTSSTWTSYSASTTSLSLSGLAAGTTYNWQVRTNCSSSSSGYTVGPNFTTSSVTSCSDNYESNNSLSAAKSIPVNTNIVALIGTSTDVDWFKFSNTSTNKNIRVTLSNLPLDYDLYLYNSSGTLLAKSENGGTTSETVKYNNGSVATYYVRVKGYNGAYSSSKCYTLNASISSTTFRYDENEESTPKEEPEISDVLIFPNPSSTGQFTFEMVNDYEGSLQMIIFDAAGRILEQTNIEKAEMILRTEINVSDKQKGMYYVRMIGEGIDSVHKLLYME